MTPLGAVAALVLFGACWGATQPLTKIALRAGYEPFGLIFWQGALGAVVLGAILVIRGRPLPLRRGAIRVFVALALIGAVIPNSGTYLALVHLPAGVHAILMSAVPMLAFPIALALGVDAFRWRRMFGLLVGMVAVLLIIGPEASLPDPAMILWVPLSLLAALCYAVEGNYVARWGTDGMEPVTTLCGTSLVAALVALPLAIGTGQFITPFKPWGASEWAIVAIACLHAAAYTGYVWLVGKTGSVFAVQISYLVTLFGVLFAFAFLGERYSGFIWGAMALMIVGLFLVQPRPRGLPGTIPGRA